MDQDKIEKLKQLSELYKAGILTKEEVEQEKNKILGKVQLTHISEGEPNAQNKENGEISQPNNNDKDEAEFPEPSPSNPTYEDYDNKEDEIKEARKKRLIYGCILLLILIGIGVFIGLYQHRQNQIAYAKEREQARKDSIAEVERMIIKHREDSIKEEKLRNFTSPDLALFNLHGHVKSVKIRKGQVYTPYIFGVPEIHFTYEGQFKHSLIEDVAKLFYDMDPSTLRIKKNERGYIIKIAESNDLEEINLYWDENKLTSYEERNGGDKTKVNYNYRDNVVIDFISQSSNEVFLAKEYCQYTNYKYDNFNNWISCEYNITGFFNYYNDDGNGEKLISHKTIEPKAGVILREIEYYE